MNDPELEQETREFIQERIEAGDMPNEIRHKCIDRGYEMHLVDTIIRRKFSDVPRGL